MFEIEEVAVSDDVDEVPLNTVSTEAQWVC